MGHCGKRERWGEAELEDPDEWRFRFIMATCTEYGEDLCLHVVQTDNVNSPCSPEPGSCGVEQRNLEGGAEDLRHGDGDGGVYSL